MTPTEEIQALNYAIAKLGAELSGAQSASDKQAAAETIQVLQAMRAALLAENKDPTPAARDDRRDRASAGAHRRHDPFGSKSPV